MSQNLLPAQPIQGRFPGRGIGIIDSLQLAEVARAATQLQLIEGVKEWFADYLVRMITHKNGQKERDAENNHGTCWTMQVARRVCVEYSLLNLDAMSEICQILSTTKNTEWPLRHSSLLSIPSPRCHLSPTRKRGSGSRGMRKTLADLALAKRE